MLLACKDIGLDKETVRKLKGVMHFQFALKMEEEGDMERTNVYLKTFAKSIRYYLKCLKKLGYCQQ